MWDSCKFFVLVSTFSQGTSREEGRHSVTEDEDWVLY